MHPREYRHIDTAAVQQPDCRQQGIDMENIIDVEEQGISAHRVLEAGVAGHARAATPVQMGGNNGRLLGQGVDRRPGRVRRTIVDEHHLHR